MRIWANIDIIVLINIIMSLRDTTGTVDLVYIATIINVVGIAKLG